MVTQPLKLITAFGKNKYCKLIKLVSYSTTQVKIYIY